MPRRLSDKARELTAWVTVYMAWNVLVMPEVNPFIGWAGFVLYAFLFWKRFGFL